MKWILAILSVLLLFAACAQSSTQRAQQAETAGIPTTEPVKETSSLEQLKTDTLAKNDKTQNVFIPLNIKKGKAGETFVFGTVFNLVNLAPGTYKLKADFNQAIDSMSNKVEITRDAANAWVEPIGSMDISSEVPVYVPITFKTPAGAASGTYTYDIYVYQIGNGFQEKVDTQSRKINVKIE